MRIQTVSAEFFRCVYHQVQYFKEHKQSQLLADCNSSLQRAGWTLTEQGWHETGMNLRSHDFPWRTCIKEKIFLFNPGDLTRSQCKVEWVPTHLAYVGAKSFC